MYCKKCSEVMLTPSKARKHNVTKIGLREGQKRTISNVVFHVRF